jgi:uncharacterized membrane protein YsdA (DUF1294 family)/cold shock CspA family protein
MKETGELTEWNDDKGYGFVEAAGGQRLFIHISAFSRPARRPEPGDRLAFTRGPGRDGRPAVVTAIIAGATRRPAAPAGPSRDRIEGAQFARALRIALAAILLMIVLLAQSLGRVPSWVIWIYFVAGVISALFYWTDKSAAQAGRWRVSEATLHVVDLAGGIIGGLLAQAALHHKTAKTKFALLTFAIVLVHITGLGAMIFDFLESSQL